MPYDEDYDEDMGDRDDDFADPGGRSALRAASKSNPRNRPCPTCGKKNKLTPKDVALGYQCDSCADKAERGID
jgi:ribosomal protein L44E